MPHRITVTPELTAELHRHTILPKYNAPAPADGAYGWLKEGTEIPLHRTLRIERNVGLYGGPYKPMVGGRRSSGLTSIGAFSYSYSPLPDLLDVGRYCSISRGLKFIDSNHPLETVTTSAFAFRPNNALFREFGTDWIREHAKGFHIAAPSYGAIGHDVWIGDNVTISPTASIGTGAVLAANATVTKDVPPYAIVGGNPAKIIRYRFDPETIERLLASHWWEYDPRQVFDGRSAGVPGLLDRIEAGELERFEVSAVTISNKATEWPTVPATPAPDAPGTPPAPMAAGPAAPDPAPSGTPPAA